MKAGYRSPDVSWWDGALPSPYIARASALSSEWEDWLAPDGETYKRIAKCENKEALSAIEAAMGRKVELLGMGYRLNFGGERPNNAVHSDLGWGTYAAVLYLSPSPLVSGGGTAFWRHKASQADRIGLFDADVLKNVESDWNNVDAWEQTSLVGEQYNRLTIYRSELFHSRWPFEAYGDSPETGRLILVAFFN